MIRGPDFQGLLLPEKGEESLLEFLSTLYMTEAMPSSSVTLFRKF